MVKREKEAVKVTIYGMIINFILVVMKLLAGIFGKSAALISDAVHSLSDFITDIIILIGFKVTARPADEDHNYGHGKVETIAAVSVGIFLIFVSVSLFINSIRNIYGFFFKDEVITLPHQFVLYILIISIILKEITFRFTIHVGKKINSDAVIANAWEHRSDVFASLAALIGLTIAIVFGEKYAVFDPIAAGIVSLFIFKVAIEIILSSYSQLIDSSLTKEEIERLEKILDSIPEIKGYHNIKTRRIGYYVSIDVHIFVERTLNVEAAHDIATELEKIIRQEFGEETFISVHVEPYYPNYPSHD